MTFLVGFLTALCPPLGLALAGFKGAIVARSALLTLLFFVPGSFYAVCKLLHRELETTHSYGLGHAADLTATQGKHV